jgi:hypothetical protein
MERILRTRQYAKVMDLPLTRLARLHKIAAPKQIEKPSSSQTPSTCGPFRHERHRPGGSKIWLSRLPPTCALLNLEVHTFSLLSEEAELSHATDNQQQRQCRPSRQVTVDQP